MATTQHLSTTLTPTHSSSPLRLAYLTSTPSTPPKGTILLLHGFPQTSHQFRHILPLLTASGYRCIAPSYRGAGPSRPAPADNDFRKTTMAADMIALLDHLGVQEKVHVVGHDIGGMIAYALASRHPNRVRSVIWGECPLPGTETYHLDRCVPERQMQQFHFIFHSNPEFASSLIAGKERMYITHFLHKISHNLDAFTPDDIDHYVQAYSQPGAMRDAMGAYADFERDKVENLAWVREEGKCAVPTMVLSGEMSRHREEAEGMVKEVTEEGVVEVGVVKGAAHYLAEEAPEEFARVVLDFVGRH